LSRYKLNLYLEALDDTTLRSHQKPKTPSVRRLNEVDPLPPAARRVADDTGSLLGRAALKAVEHHDGIAGLAHWMVADATARGLCTQSAKALCEWAFAIGFHRIEAEHSTATSAVPAAAQGFTPTVGTTGICTHY
jgi:hypothetical protein